MNEPQYTLIGGDVNTLVCKSFSEAYYSLFQYIRKNGALTGSRLGETREILNFKTVITTPQKRVTISLKRRVNIFFHLAESLWVLTGRNDLEFIDLFNSRFKSYSDDGEILHGAYGERLRGGVPDQFFTIAHLLNKDPDLRRTVISLWNPERDLAKPYKDVPCNVQLFFRVRGNDLYLTIANRSNDLHWGVIANIFQFSFLGEIMALILGKNYAVQTHLSLSLHYYTDNELNDLISDSDIHQTFYNEYPESIMIFNFDHSLDDFEARFAEIDEVMKNIPDIILAFRKDETQTLEHAFSIIQPLKEKSATLYETTYLLLLYISYQQEGQSSADRTKLRLKYIALLAKQHFHHRDWWAAALNFFIAKLKDRSVLRELGILDVNLGEY
jgi:thymidylate synthase